MHAFVIEGALGTVDQNDLGGFDALIDQLVCCSEGHHPANGIANEMEAIGMMVF